MSASSINKQFQLTLEVWDLLINKQLVEWFDKLWDRADQVDHSMVQKLNHLWRKRIANNSGQRTNGKLPRWRSKAPQPPLDPSQLSVSLKKPKLNELLSEFSKNKCSYDDEISCSEEAAKAEKDRKKRSQALRSLMRRRSWKKNDLDKLFRLAYPFGQITEFNRPAFVRQNPLKVARSLRYLLEGGGDPYIRFEKVLAAGNRYKLAGIGKAGLTVLMHLWNPAEFAFVMGPLKKAFRRLNITFDRTKSIPPGQRYKNETAVIKHVGKLTGLNSLVQTDRFLDAVAKEHIGHWRNS